MIRNLNRQTRRLKKLVVSKIGLDQPALDAAFKDACKDQALRHRHIAREHPYPINLFDISISIGQRKREGDQRQPANSPAVRDPAAPHHQNKRERRTQGLPAQHEVIAFLIPILPIRQNAGWKGKHLPVQIIGQNEQKQKQCRDIQKLCPSRQAKSLVLPQRLGNKDRQHGNKQHWKIVEIPQPALRVRIAN